MSEIEPMLDIDKVRELIRRGYDLLETHGVDNQGLISYHLSGRFHIYINRYGLAVTYKLKYLFSCADNEFHVQNLDMYDDALSELRQLMVLDDIANA